MCVLWMASEVSIRQKGQIALLAFNPPGIGMPVIPYDRRNETSCSSVLAVHLSETEFHEAG